MKPIYEDNGNLARKRLRYRSEHEDIDELTWRWFQRVRAKNTLISGPMIQEQARMYAKELNKLDFSNGWLARFKNHHNISAGTLSGKRALVDQAMLNPGKSAYPTSSRITLCVTSGAYEPLRLISSGDIYNLDETGLFFCALPTKAL